MAVPYTFANATTSIPLSQLDSNFATTITLGVTPVALGNTYTTLANVTFSNVTISSTTSANLSSNATVDGTNKVGYLTIPQDLQTGNYTITLADAGKHIYYATNAAATFTIPNNATTAFTVGTAVSFVNLSNTNVTITISTDTMYLASTGNTANRTLASYGLASALKVANTTWIISGVGLT
jgi:hypothetical protein